MNRILISLLFLIPLGCAQFTADQAEQKMTFSVVNDEGAPVDEAAMAQTIQIVNQRLWSDDSVQSFLVQSPEPGMLEVLTPNLDSATIDQIKTLLTRSGTLEFALLANRRDHANLIDQIEAGGEMTDGELTAKWLPTRLQSDGSRAVIDGDQSTVTRTVTTDGVDHTEFLLVFGPEERRVTGKFLKSARTYQSQTGSEAVRFEFNDRGGYLFQQLTSANQPTPDGFRRRLAVLVDNEILSAPTINAVIGASGAIEGNFSKEEAAQLANLFNAGELPGTIEFVNLEAMEPPKLPAD